MFFFYLFPWNSKCHTNINKQKIGLVFCIFFYYDLDGNRIRESLDRRSSLIICSQTYEDQRESYREAAGRVWSFGGRRTIYITLWQKANTTDLLVLGLAWILVHQDGVRSFLCIAHSIELIGKILLFVHFSALLVQLQWENSSENTGTSESTSESKLFELDCEI